MPHFHSPPLAPFACDPCRSRGRLHDEQPSPGRNAFQRDRDRVVHCGAFRRLQYKTQVFVYHEGENYRTRLTHSLEVMQIARSIARSLGLHEDLAEALALAHDLGHTPFGHAGEAALQECLRDVGGFDHNAQSLRIVTSLEKRYIAFDGLNLSWETLEGLVKHNGPLIGQPDSKNLPLAVEEYVKQHNLELDLYAGLEAQVAALADDIAYNAHDFDDGLRAGLLRVEDLMDLPLIGGIVADLRHNHCGLERSRLIYETMRALISAFVRDLLAETRRRLAEDAPSSADEVRANARPLVAFSETMRAQDKTIKQFLYLNVYRHHQVNRMASKARRIVCDLFHLFLEQPELLPPDWSVNCSSGEHGAIARHIADYIAGMSDRFAIDEHVRLFNPSVRP